MSRRRRPVVFGEVLFDRFPDGSEILGGAPFNVAWNLRGLGLDPLLVSRIGRDAPGERILEAMRRFGMDTSGIQRDSLHPTGTVVVELEDGEPHFEIVAEQAYDHLEMEELPDPASGGSGGLLYHGSLALRSPGSAQALQGLRERLKALDPGTTVFFDVNLRAPWWHRGEIEEWMRSADHLKLNDSELAQLVDDGSDERERALRLREDCDAETLWLTRGERGAWAFSRDGEMAGVEPRDRVELVDTVGAGDAFASVLIFAILEGWRTAEALFRAQQFAEAVVGLRGATTTDAAFYARFPKLWSIG